MRPLSCYSDSVTNMEARPHLVSGSVFKTDEARTTPGLAGSIPVRFRNRSPERSMPTGGASVQ